MRSKPYWPLEAMTVRQKKKYAQAWTIALDKAGGVNKLANVLSDYTDECVSHQAIRNWRNANRIPPQWALVLERYTNGEVNFFDLVPWLLPRTVRYSDEVCHDMPRCYSSDEVSTA